MIRVVHLGFGGLSTTNLCFSRSAYMRIGWTHLVRCFCWIWEPDEVNPVPIRFAISFNFWEPDGVVSGSHHTHRMTPPPLHLVLILRIGRLGVRFSNFKKRESDALSRCPFRNL